MYCNAVIGYVTVSVEPDYGRVFLTGHSYRALSAAQLVALEVSVARAR